MSRDLDIILKAIKDIEPSPATVEAFNSILLDVRKNNKSLQSHMVHLARISEAVNTLNIIVLENLIDELMLEIGLLRTYDYTLNPSLFKDVSTSNKKEVYAPAFYYEQDGKKQLIKNGIVQDAKKTKIEKIKDSLSNIVKKGEQ